MRSPSLRQIRRFSYGKRRLIQWLIPLLYGVGVSVVVVRMLELLLRGRDAVAYAFFFGIGALGTALIIKIRRGYNWPWESPAELSSPQERRSKSSLRDFTLWGVVVLVLFALFTFLQPTGPGLR
jgi:hypothetical protein